MLSATFSIAARDEGTGMLGVAIASKALAVGAHCPFVREGVGAISTQSYFNPNLGINGLTLLAQGLSATETLEHLLNEDDGRQWRQVNIVDSQGESAAFSGVCTEPWSGSCAGPNYALSGNLLVGEAVVRQMERAFVDNPHREFGERLLSVLEAGEAGGGDRRGKQAAGLYVVHRQSFPYINLRVDDHPEPVRELRRLFTLAQESGLLDLTRRLSDTLKPDSVEDNEKHQRELRQRLGIPLDDRLVPSQGRADGFFVSWK